jgi:aromatic ring-opening dioxygenase catalytic subunit (LigB family)
MGQILAAFGVSHAPGIRAWPEAADEERFGAFEKAWARLEARVAALRPDAIVQIASEHWANFSLAHMPSFCIGLADVHEGPVENWLRVPKTKVPGHPALAAAILERAHHDGVDLSFSHELALDHGSIVPLSYVTPAYDVPLVPIIQNCLAAPLPPLRRSWALGESIRRAVEKSDLRVVVIGSGGLSHWPGELRHGEVNSAFDRRFLEHCASGAGHVLAGWQNSLIQEAGSGAAEIRNWVTALATVPERPFEVLFYEPFKGFATGCALAMSVA